MSASINGSVLTNGMLKSTPGFARCTSHTTVFNSTTYMYSKETITVRKNSMGRDLRSRYTTATRHTHSLSVNSTHIYPVHLSTLSMVNLLLLPPDFQTFNYKPRFLSFI